MELQTEETFYGEEQQIDAQKEAARNRMMSTHDGTRGEVRYSIEGEVER